MDSSPKLLVAIPPDIIIQDCACAEDPGLPPPPLPPLSPTIRLHQHPTLHRAALADGYQTAFSVGDQARIVVLNRAAQELLDAYQQPHTPPEMTARFADRPSGEIEDATHQLLTVGLLHPFGLPSIPLYAPPQTLTAWLHVTNACNLRCAYCYLHKTDEAMDEETARAAVEAVVRSAQSHDFRTIKLKYAGGEASLNFPLIRTIHQHAATLTAQTGLGLREVVLSNGVALTPAMLDFLREEGIGLMISLDGVGAAHDAQRFFINGRGSFQHVARTLERALDHGLLPHLSITVTARNADQLPEAVAFALDRDLPFNLNFYRENDCAASADDLAHAQTQLIAGMKAAFALIETRLPRRSLVDGLVDRSAFSQPHQYGCGAGHNYMVIDQAGRVARCQMEIERPVTTVMAADPLHHIRVESSGFQNLPTHEKEGCKSCEWRSWCAGGCSLLTYRVTGRNDIRSPYCEVYKSLYPDVVRLEGLRLLKWATATD